MFFLGSEKIALAQLDAGDLSAPELEPTSVAAAMASSRDDGPGYLGQTQRLEATGPALAQSSEHLSVKQSATAGPAHARNALQAETCDKAESQLGFIEQRDDYLEIQEDAWCGML